jgi:hypothetical protein
VRVRVVAGSWQVPWTGLCRCSLFARFCMTTLAMDMPGVTSMAIDARGHLTHSCCTIVRLAVVSFLRG